MNIIYGKNDYKLIEDLIQQVSDDEKVNKNLRMRLGQLVSFDYPHEEMIKTIQKEYKLTEKDNDAIINLINQVSEEMKKSNEEKGELDDGR